MMNARTEPPYKTRNVTFVFTVYISSYKFVGLLKPGSAVFQDAIIKHDKSHTHIHRFMRASDGTPKPKFMLARTLLQF